MQELGLVLVRGVQLELAEVEGRQRIGFLLLQRWSCWFCGLLFNFALITSIETITDTMIRSLMEVQEKIHLTAGRKRQKVSIGIHDLDRVAPPFLYAAIKPEEVSFVPLGKTDLKFSRVCLGTGMRGWKRDT